MTETPIAPLHMPDVDTEAMKDWAELLRDANPIHLDAAAVRALGLGDAPINQGPRNLAVVLNAILRALPDADVTQFSARLQGNVYAGDSITAEGHYHRDGAQITCTARLLAEGRGTVLTVEAQLRDGQKPGEETR